MTRPPESSPSRSALRDLPLDRIQPARKQARRQFSAESLAELAASIAEIGVVQPVVVRSTATGFELLAGERRWRAAQLAGLEVIPAWLRDDLSDTEAEILGLVENLQREALSPIETAQGLQQLALAGFTHGQIAEKLGKTRVYVSHHLGLLKLLPSVQERINDGRLSLGHAKVFTGLSLEQQALWQDRAGDLSVRQFEQALRRQQAKTDEDGQEAEALVRHLSDHFGLPIRLEGQEVRIRFHSLEELQGLLQRWGVEGG
jgi:ParB family chromosome partitioning protein